MFDRSSLSVLFAFALALSSTSAAHSENLYGTHFIGANAKVCYARTYTDAHLEKHKKQKVRTIALTEISETETESSGDVAAFDLKFGVVGRDKPDRYWGVAYCETKGPKATCHIEGDGGMFTLSPRDDGGLTVETNGLGFEGDADFFHFGNKSDDKVFHLGKTSSDACNVFQ